eukprot:1672429-Amphidinium_carterae.1
MKKIVNLVFGSWHCVACTEKRSRNPQTVLHEGLWHIQTELLFTVMWWLSLRVPWRISQKAFVNAT